MQLHHENLTKDHADETAGTKFLLGGILTIHDDYQNTYRTLNKTNTDTATNVDASSIKPSDDVQQE